MRRYRLHALVIAGAITLAGCAGGSRTGSGITVYAASSLQKAFTELGTRFEQANPGTSVTFNFGGSSDLVAQLQQGAPADVFASADRATMDRAVEDGLIAGTPQDFASNSMEIVVPEGNPAGVTSFASLAGADLKVVVCAPQVPCGAATATIEEHTGVTLSPVSEENSVTDVLGKVMSGQADAGVVYKTDVKGAGNGVAGVRIPRSVNAVNTYPMGVLSASPNEKVAVEFLDFVLGPQGQQVLVDAGFGRS